jgi:hypothetical protein
MLIIDIISGIIGVVIIGSISAVVLGVVIGAATVRRESSMVQTGGMYDPYSNLRFWTIIDVLRDFWLTK